TVAAIERAAFAAWPADDVAPLDGWWCRAMCGVSRRANSVWLSEADSALPVAERIDRVEAWYAARGLPATFQVTPLARPTDLDAVLEQRKYRIDAPVSIQVARAGALREPLRDGIRVHVEDTPSNAWFEISAHRGRFAKVADVYRALLD